MAFPVVHKTLQAVVIQAHRNFDLWRYWFSFKIHECLITQLEFIFLSNLNDVCSWLSSGGFLCCCSIAELPIHFQASEREIVWQEKNSMELEGPGTLHAIQDRRVKLWIRAQTQEIYPQEIIHVVVVVVVTHKGSSSGIWVSCHRNSMHNDFENIENTLNHVRSRRAQWCEGYLLVAFLISRVFSKRN